MIPDVTHVTVLVDDQYEALPFYTETLGFEIREDIGTGDDPRWLTVAPAGAAFPQIALIEAGTARERVRVGTQAADHTVLVLRTEDCQQAYERLRNRGVTFRDKPAEKPWGTEATLEDPSGNVLGLFEPKTVIGGSNAG
ncbi:VOC family protein [Halocatena marina]|uniref:VOC family protein n=1 Tax=Halocatena marina TaxID=2934937 RepID=A0ABD5YRZ7_9EURY|nr:VOC family protein [Halocatena marina]